LSDTNKLWDQIDVSGLVSFVIHETTRVGGCAELTPDYELNVHRANDTRESGKVGV
jgi:hypothetical protein